MKILARILLPMIILIVVTSFSPNAFAYFPKRPYSYSSSQAGCLTDAIGLLDRHCAQLRLSFTILKSLSQSKRKEAQEQLEELIVRRAKYFLERKEQDYFSILSLMIFPIKQRDKWLQRFALLSKKGRPFTEVAMARIVGKTPRVCSASTEQRKRSDLAEICQMPL